VQPPLLSR